VDDAARVRDVQRFANLHRQHHGPVEWQWPAVDELFERDAFEQLHHNRRVVR
jgi:hypothetical protein